MNKTILVKDLSVLLDVLQEDDLLFVNAHGDLGVLRAEPGRDSSLIGVINMTQGVDPKDRWDKPYTDAYLLHSIKVKELLAVLQELNADWMGASMTYTGSWVMTDWLGLNLPKIKIHPETVAILKEILSDLGYSKQVESL